MKANYLLKNRLGQPYLKRVIILMAVFLSGVILFTFFGSVIISVIAPIWRAENVVTRSLRNGVFFFNSQKFLVNENAILKDKVSFLEAEILSLSSSQTEKSVLLALLDRKQNSNVITAAVLTHPPQTPYDVLIIDAGSNEFVTLGSEVLLPEGSILGVVSEVFRKYAKVKLLSADGTEKNAILERNSVPLTLIGIGGGNFKIVLPRDMGVEKGDKILSPDITSRLLAVVEEINIKPTDSFKEVLAKSPINIFSLRFVFVMPR